MSRFSGGFVVLPRSITNELNNSELAIFARLMSWAAFEDGKIPFVWEGNPRLIRRGEVVTSLSELAASRDNGDIQSVRRALRHLEIRQTIRQTVNKQGRIITICNYDEIVNNAFANDKQTTDITTNRRQTGDKQATILEQITINKGNNLVIMPERVDGFGLTFDKKYQEIVSFLQETKIWSPKVRSNLTQIVNSFESKQELEAWFLRVKSSPNYPKEFQLKQRYFITALLDEIGVINAKDLRKHPSTDAMR